MGTWHLDPKRKEEISKQIGNTLRQIHYKTDFFKEIVSEDRAYWLGYLFADGCVLYDEEKHEYQAMLDSTDYEVLYNFATALDYPVEKIVPNQKTKSHYAQSYHVVLCGKEIAQDLISHGCLPRKTYKQITMPSLDQKLQHHFVRGFFDGDGCIYFMDKKHLTFQLCGPFSLMDQIQDLIVQNCEVKKNKLTQDKNTKFLYYLSYSGNKQSTKIFAWLYRGSTIYMSRKKNLFERFLLKNEKAILPGSGLGFYQFNRPNSKILKTFKNPHSVGEPSTIMFESHEMTTLCPLTGFPDYYRLKLSYVPRDTCIESKSMKLYLSSYREYSGFIETVAEQVVSDIVKACMPQQGKLDLTMVPRGGISINVTKEF